MRLIDADELAQGMIWVGEQTDGATSILANRLARLLKDDVFAPTIDAVPVVHARWLPRGSDDNDAGMYYCSACKDERYFGDEVITSEEASKYCPFCPNCGAKMDGGAEG